MALSDHILAQLAVHHTCQQSIGSLIDQGAPLVDIVSVFDACSMLKSESRSAGSCHGQWICRRLTEKGTINSESHQHPSISMAILMKATVHAAGQLVM